MKVQFVVESKRGKRCVIVDNYKLSDYRDTKHGEKMYRCTRRYCRAYVIVEPSTDRITRVGVQSHNHKKMTEQELAKEVIKYSAVRRALDDRQALLTNIVKEEMDLKPELAEKLTSKDSKQIQKWCGARRRQLADEPSQVMTKIPEIQYVIDSKKGKRCIVVDNYKLSEYRKPRQGKQRYRCTRKVCRASVIVEQSSDQITEVSIQPHNHKKMSEQELAKEVIKCSAVRRALADRETLPRHIVNREMDLNPDLAKILTSKDKQQIRKRCIARRWRSGNKLEPSKKISRSDSPSSNREGEGCSAGTKGTGQVDKISGSDSPSTDGEGEGGSTGTNVTGQVDKIIESENSSSNGEGEGGSTGTNGTGQADKISESGNPSSDDEGGST